MRIAQLSTRYPPGPGGVERHVAEISKRLVQRGNSVTALATDLYREIPWEPLPPSVPRTEVTDGVRVRRLKAFTLPGELHYPFFRGLSRALGEEKPDVVHVHTYGTNHASVARRYARRTQTPYVLTAHYHPIWSIHGGWLRHRLRGFYDRTLAGPIVGDAARLIVQTHEEERLVRENGFPLPKVEIIPPGYTPLPPPVEGPHPFSDSIGIEGPFVLFVGRLASNKGLLPLVDAFRTLAKHDESSQLVLVGEDGGVRAAVEAKVRDAGLTDRVRFAGFLVDERMLSAAFREARLFVLPSEYEAFGLVLLEALAQGTPVVASRVGGIPEFVPDGEAGRLVTPTDPVSLSNAFLELWDDEPRRRRMGAFGRDQVVPNYTWERVVDRLLGVYGEVVGKVKVGLVTLRFDAPGGVETNVRAVARGLRDAGDDVQVFASDLHDEEHWERRSDYPPQVDGVPVHRFPVYKRLIPGVTMPMWTGLMPALARSGVDVVHAHSHRYGHVLQCAAVSRATRIPLVVSTHYHPADRRESSKKRALLRVQDHLFGMTAYRQAAAIVVETQLEAQRVAEFAPRNRIEVIPPGVDLAAWGHPEQDLPPPGLPEEFVLYAGRIASNKGLRFLVDAIADLPREGRPSLVILGADWGEKAALVELATRRGIAGSVVFPGHLASLSEYRAIVRRARAFVLPSEWEAYGLVLLEAMAARTPIVASAVGGVPEVLEGGRSGELVPYGDPKALADALQRLLHDETRRETLRSEGDRRVRELTWTVSVERHRRLYEKILSGTRSGRAR